MVLRAFHQTTPTLGKRVFIDDSAIVTGNITIGDDSSVWPLCSLRGDLLSITIGNNTNIQDGTVIHTSHASQFQKAAQVIIGNNVTVGHKAMVHGCTIHDTSLIGMGAIVLDHAVIESYVILGAGSVVGPGKVLESGYVWRGCPARKARSLTQDERTFLTYSAESYVRLKNQHMHDQPL